MIKKIFINFLIIIFSFLATFSLCEILLRAKHTLFYDYDIEQWKYAKTLKTKDYNPKIGHTHIASKKAKLQGVEIKINKYGQRDREYNNNVLKNYDRSFLFIGSSIALGWGVESSDTFISRLNELSKAQNKNWIFINGGIGNYNTERYINNYFENWKNFEFTDLVIHYFVNDSEVINQDNSNFFTRNFQTAVIIWKYLNSLKSEYSVENLTEYYEKKYDNNYIGYQNTLSELERLGIFCSKKKINCHLVMMPDIHQLNPYELKFINNKIKKNSENLNFKYHDLLEDLEIISPSKLLWNDFNDPHPNIFAHKIISESLINFFIK
jgi:hypothetical protein